MTNLICGTSAERNRGENYSLPARPRCDEPSKISGKLRVKNAVGAGREIRTVLFENSARHDEDSFRTIQFVNFAGVEISKLKNLRGR